MNKGTYFCHPQSVEWYTPPWIFDALGLDFDLDPCSPISGPTTPAKKHFTTQQNGLLNKWHGMVWLNPPYGKALVGWMRKMALHNQGVALIYARTDTATFHRYVWERASGIFFFRGRLYFIRQDGSLSGQNAGGPSCLVSYGPEAREALRNFGSNGKAFRVGYFVELSGRPVL